MAGLGGKSAPPRIPFADLRAQHRSIEAEVTRAALAVVEAQAFILGEPVATFERTLAALCGAREAVGVASGTDALVLALRALGVGAGDAVLTTAFSFIAPAEAIAAVGARPLFVDIDPRTFNLSAAGVAERIARCERAADGGLVDAASGARLRALLPVHLFGLPAPMDELVGIARAHGLFVVEDAAQAIGARVGGVGGGVARTVGSLGDAGCFSFFPSKNLGGWGDGGAVVTSDPRLAERVRRLRAHGASATSGAYAHDEVGVNSRLDALQAAVLSAKARHLGAWTEARVRVAARYREGLASVQDRVRLPPATPGHVYNQFVVRSAERDGLARALADEGIETKLYYPIALPDQPCFGELGAAREAFPVAREATRTALALPIYPELDDAAVDRVASVVRAFHAGAAALC